MTYLVPAFGVLWGGLALAEAVGSGTVLGLVVILLGIWIVVGARTRAARGGAEPPRSEPEVDAREGP